MSADASGRGASQDLLSGSRLDEAVKGLRERHGDNAWERVRSNAAGCSGGWAMNRPAGRRHFIRAAL